MDTALLGHLIAAMPDGVSEWAGALIALAVITRKICPYFNNRRSNATPTPEAETESE